MRSTTLILSCTTALAHVVIAQSPDEAAAVQFSIGEEIGLPLSKVQVMDAVLDAWQYSFGLEPGAAIIGTDRESGSIECTARVNYRSRQLIGREETMGVVTYLVSIHAANGQCSVLVHGLRHTGNHSAPNGGLDMGPIFSGKAPSKRYPGIGLGQSQRMHADAREVAREKLENVLSLFSARLRLLGER